MQLARRGTQPIPAETGVSMTEIGFFLEIMDTLRGSRYGENMIPEVWVRNPDLCIKECIEEQVDLFVWDRGYISKRAIDPARLLDVYMPMPRVWRTLIIGFDTDDAIELRPGYSETSPWKVHPVWRFGQEMAYLEDVMDDAETERVVIANVPPAQTGPAKQFYRHLRELQEEHPNVIVHVHGLYSWRVMFGLGFRSVDIEPRETAKKGKVILPPGKEVTYERAAEAPHWVTLLGMRPLDLRVPRNRCMYNIRSAHWAARFFHTDIKYKSNGRVEIDPDAYTNPIFTQQRIMTRNMEQPLPGDKFLCDMCSLQLHCRYFRTGSVCSVPDSEPAELAKFFKTRDSDTIIEGLGTLLATQTRRLARALDSEDVDEKVNPEVTKIINTLFDRGVKLAKLVNPALAAAGAAKFTINNNSRTAVLAGTPQALMASVVAELEARGIPRDRITPEMVEMLLGKPDEVRSRAIEVVVAERAR